jgi:hypothetical protein
MSSARRAVIVSAIALASALESLGCGTSAPGARATHGAEAGEAGVSIGAEAGFVDVPPRAVTLAGRSVSIGATAHLFYNLRPADMDPATKPIFFLSNGFTAETVRAYGTGPTTVVEGGDVVANATPLTGLANLVYLEPRQAGYSYDVVEGRPPTAATDCSPDIFNEYVDAADFLWGALEFLEAHPQLTGPVVWFGESYAGVRVTWAVAYLRNRFDLANYGDPMLAAKIAAAAVQRPAPGSLFAAQVFLQPWLAGSAHALAIADACVDPTETAAVAATLASGCGDAGACDCADTNMRSRYEFEYSVSRQNARDSDGSNAHIILDRAAALLGVPLTSIAGLDAVSRGNGFKCSVPNDLDSSETVPDETPLVDALGALPAGQWWYLPFSPLQPDTDTSNWTRDWETQPFEGVAFVDNLHDVPTFLTNGGLDLVVPYRALAPALSRIIDPSRVDTANGQLGVIYPDVERFIGVGAYPNAGHMITMLAAADFASDLAAWLPVH